MTVVKPTTQLRPSGAKNAPIFSGPTDKEIADLQVKKVTLINEIDTANKELNTLAGKKVGITREIEKEQAIYDSMVLKPHAELQADLEKRIGEHQVNLQELERQLTFIREDQKKQQKIIDVLFLTSEQLDKDIEKKKLQFSEESTLAQNKLVDIKNQISQARTELNILLSESHNARVEATHAHTDMIAYRNQQKDYVASLERKARDLAIWQNRLDPLFKIKHPDAEMKFI